MLSPREYQVQLITFSPALLQANPEIEVNDTLYAVMCWAQRDDDELDAGNGQEILLDLCRAAEEGRDPRDVRAMRRTPSAGSCRVIPFRRPADASP